MAEQKRRRVTTRTLQKKMENNEQIVQMAIYDYRSAVIADREDIDILCVSDTGGMILFGHQSTVTVTFDEVMMMAKAIDRGSLSGGQEVVSLQGWILGDVKFPGSQQGMDVKGVDQARPCCRGGHFPKQCSLFDTPQPGTSSFRPPPFSEAVKHEYQ